MYGGRAAYNYLTRPQPQVVYVQGPPPPMRGPPVTPSARGGARGRGRRGGRRGRRGNASVAQLSRGLSGVSLSGGSTATFVDAECVGVGDNSSLTVTAFNPGCCQLPRLQYEAAKWTRFRINYINIAFITTSSITDAGSVYVGIVNGVAKEADFPAATRYDKVMALRPSFAVPTWKNDSLSLGNNIMPMRTMPVELTAASLSLDTVPFSCIKAVSDKGGNKGIMKWSYSITFSHPHA